MSELSLSVVPVLPVWVIALLGVALLGVLAHGSFTLLHRQVPPRWVWALGGLRTGIVVLFLLFLLQPVLSYTRTVERRPQMLVLLDTSASMAQPGGNEGLTRFQEVVRGLSEQGLASELGRRFDLRWFAFDTRAIPLKGTEWATLTAGGDTTNYARSLRQAWDFSHFQAATGPGAERVLLVSDGQDHGSPDIVEVARQVGVAIDVLAPGSPPLGKAPPPITIADVQGSPRVLLGSETHFLVTAISASIASEDRTRTVVLREGDKVLAQETVVLRRGRAEERVRLAHRPTELGPRRYEFAIEGAPPLALNVQVVDGKHEVLVLEDTWRWELKFLRRVLEEDPSFRFTALLSRGGGAFMQFASPDRRSLLIGLPRDPGQLACFDTVILGDVDPRRWPRELTLALWRSVAEEGKSLVVIAGPNLLHWAELPDLAALLPVEITRETASPVVGPISVRVTTEGAQSAFFLQPGAEPMAPRLPDLDQIYPPLRKKLAATTLLEAAGKGNSYGPFIVMAEHTVGAGRVLFIGTDTLWKWQTLGTATDANSTPYHRFWQQALRALAPLRPSGPAVNVWLQPVRSHSVVGQRAAIEARIDSSAVLPGMVVQGVVSSPDRRARRLSFTPSPGYPNIYIAELEPQAAGPYLVAASVVSEGQKVADGTTTLEVQQGAGEQDGAPVDLANLARIAAATGGKVIDPNDPRTWPISTAGGPVVMTERQTIDWASRWYVLVVLAVVAGTDWLLRLLRGYV
jgi:hypothetical protein